MSENNIKHFETLWEESEKLAGKIYSETPTEELIKLISESLTSYFETEQLNSKEIVDSLKNKHIGDIVFMMTALSIRDNINVYAALQEQCVLRNIG